MATSLRFLDLFSGIGGFRLGVTRAARKLGIHSEPVGFVECDLQSTDLYRSYFAVEPDEPYARLVQQLRVNGRHPNGGVTFPQFDLLCAGFPCQSFSNVGLRGGLEDPRGELFFEVV